MIAQTAHFPPNQSRNALYRVLKLQGALRHDGWEPTRVLFPARNR